jgi:glucose-6-phosphate 1-dehydrogenase
MIDRLLLFGATGDLAGRFLLPAVAALHADERLPAGFSIIATARDDWDDTTFRRHASERVERHAATVPATSRAAVVDMVIYRPVDITDPEQVAAVLRDRAAAPARPVAVYLALPPAVFAPTLATLCAVGLPPGSRIAVEKPFGEDVQGAAALNDLLRRCSASTGGETAFRVDHVLGMATVQNLVGLRLSNRVLDAVWNSTHIERIEVHWEETLALEGRAGYYDRAGVLVDVMQNHMLQVLALTAMEPPTGSGEEELRDAKVEILRALRPPIPDDLMRRTRRARYTNGVLADSGGASGDWVPDYVAEEGVEPGRGTETFAEVAFDLDTPRWAGTGVVLRAGKALRQRRKGVLVVFRPTRDPGTGGGPRQVTANRLWIGIDGPDDLRLDLSGRSADPPHNAQPVLLEAAPPPTVLPPYSRVLLDILQGGHGLSVRGDEAEEAWRAIEPVAQGWRQGYVPLEDYPAGSDGPTPRTAPGSVVDRRP